MPDERTCANHQYMDRTLMQVQTGLDKLSSGVEDSDKAVQKYFATIQENISGLATRVEFLSRYGEDRDAKIRKLEEFTANCGPYRDKVDRSYDAKKWVIGLAVTISMTCLGGLYNVFQKLAETQYQMTTAIELLKKEDDYMKKQIQGHLDEIKGNRNVGNR